MQLEFFVPGKPRGKERPRFWNGRAVTPKNTRADEEEITWAAKAAGAKPLDVSCRVDIGAFFPIPASWSQKKQHPARCGWTKPTIKPDVDNVAKVVLDALNGVAFTDDTHVTDLTVAKRFHDEPGVMVRIYYEDA